MGIVKTIMKKNPEMINDALLAYRAAPLTNNEYSHAELMLKRNVKAHVEEKCGSSYDKSTCTFSNG